MATSTAYRPKDDGLTVQQLGRFLLQSLGLLLSAAACLHLFFIVRFTLLLGHLPIPMIDDPDQLGIHNPFCDWYIDKVQWRFGPLGYYLTLSFWMVFYLGARLYFGWRRHRFFFALMLCLFSLFIIFGWQIMLWLED